MSVCSDELVHLTEKGLYCPAGEFYIDPWAPVARAIITHGHSDHARVGSSEYFAHPSTVKIMQHRFAQTGSAGLPLFENVAGLGAELTAQMHPVPYRQSVNFSDVKVSLHPAGHILGSAQVRIEHKGKITVVSGDYKLSKVSSMALDDLTCEPFELVQCDTFITESTFALPIYKFRPTIEVVAEIYDWWVECARLVRSALLLAYSLGKAQRVLAALRQLALSGSLTPNFSGNFPGPILVHPAVHSLCEIYRAEGVELPDYQVMGRHSQASSSQGNQPSMSGSASDSSKADTFQADSSHKNSSHKNSSHANSYESNSDLDLESKELESGDNSSVLKNGGALIIAPPALAESKLARSANVSLGFASGWMQVRGQRRRRNVDRGFVLSDHADWQSLTKTIFATGAASVLVTHGSSGSLVRFLREHGLEANDLQTRFEGGE